MRTRCIIAIVGIGLISGCSAQSVQSHQVVDQLAWIPATETAPSMTLAEHDGVYFTGVAIHREAMGNVIQGRVRSSAQCGLAASRSVRVQALTTEGAVVWTRIAGIQTKPVIRRSRVKQNGSFRVVLPEEIPFSHLRIEIVDTASVACANR